MADEIEIKSNFKKVEASLVRKSVKLEPEIKKDLKFWGLESVNHIKTKRFGGKTTDSSLANRSGQLRARMDFEVEVAGGLVDGSFKNNLPYAAIHEFGGTIKPKKGTYLSIPLDHVKTAGGVARGGPRDYPDLVFVQTGKNNPILFDTAGNQFEPAFVLVKSVTIKARLGIRETINLRKKELTQALGVSFINA